jgi:hypothetical protein
VSISELKSNVTRKVLLPGLGNDWWRFVVDVCILTAGSPYGKDLSASIFREYTEFVVRIVLRDEQSVWYQRILNFTGGGSMALVVSFALILFLLCNCRKTVIRDRRRRQRIMVHAFYIAHLS